MYEIYLEENYRRSRRYYIIGLAVSIVISGLLAYLGSFLTSKHEIPAVCLANNIRPSFHADPKRINERSELFPHDSYILANSTVIDGDGEEYHQTDLLISNGTIVDIGQGLIYQYSTPKVLNLNGKYVSPGLIDCHSHFGTRAQPQMGRSTEDTNEFTSPATPYVRSIDGINPNDPELDSLVASGVTSHLVLTGSKNLLSGESYGIKLHRSPNNLVQEMLIQYNVQADIQAQNKLVRWFKIAYGENQKASNLPGYPVSRMGESWVLRNHFYKAQQLKISQDRWCSDPKLQTHEYPTDFELNTVVDILRGDLNINVHLYETYDFETLLRVADEFNVTIGSFHHALSGYKVIKLLRDHNASIAIFADEFGGKKEQYEATVKAPMILEQNGIPVAIKTDHPALPGQDLLYYAQIAHNFGLSAKASIASVTSVPATIMSMNHRIGYLRKGYDADIVIWDDHPLNLGVKPQEIVVDGIAKFGFAKLSNLTKTVRQPKQRHQQEPDICGSESFVISGISTSLVQSSSSIKIEQNCDSPVVVVRNNHIQCIGTLGFCQAENLDVVQLENGFFLPGITALSASIGMTEMTLEESTSDGLGESFAGTLCAKDGLLLDGHMLSRISNSGVNLAISAPLGTHFMKGISTRFSLGGRTLNESILEDQVAIHFSVGSNAKSAQFPTISSQIQALRVFMNGSDHDHLPIAIHTHNKAIILQIIQLKQEFPHKRIIIIGGQESYLLADQLALNDIPAVLSPWRCTDKFWENRRCSPNTPLMEDSSVNILHKAGVKFGLSLNVDNDARRTLWEASLAGKAIPGYNMEQTVGLISSNLEEIFGLNSSNDFVIFNDNPFEFGASLAFSFSNGRLERCFPDYEEVDIGSVYSG